MSDYQIIASNTDPVHRADVSIWQQGVFNRWRWEILLIDNSFSFEPSPSGSARTYRQALERAQGWLDGYANQTGRGGRSRLAKDGVDRELFKLTGGS